MFSLTDSLRYWYYNSPTDMRKSFHTLGGIVTNVMRRDPYSGEVFCNCERLKNTLKCTNCRGFHILEHCMPSLLNGVAAVFKINRGQNAGILPTFEID